MVLLVSLQIAILLAHFLYNVSEFNESLYWHLEKVAQVLRATQHFSAAITDSKLAHYLGTDEHETVLLVTREQALLLTIDLLNIPKPDFLTITVILRLSYTRKNL
ncbi:hypothetical protein M5G07_11565 [Serratia symbiotica]|nr:hypothetical protein [Serratia symbiotica]